MPKKPEMLWIVAVLVLGIAGVAWAGQDADGVADAVDNCIAAPNADQADADGDGYGDACEAPCDLTGDNVVGVPDFSLLSQGAESSCDEETLRSHFGAKSGPSANH